ncbi:DHA2 family efflux MFS transporter permease subunit [Cohnella abietis]|uniref:Multidrug resistance protein 3 n=1 Tax=Cohnella abietis TaxID=2507935 RepID=A0A3T1D7H7_9BACL|nr:DHA2 family efflux MFS transporter permease subunit [Cohnella abietis]BBI34040.1 multidrug resistance protein 3 [Cohnella abietis]
MNEVTKKSTGLIILSIALGLLMSSLDNTIVSASITKVIEDIHGFDKVAWVFTAYMLAATSTMLVFGKMSDLFGRKRFYLIGISLFLIGSALCGVATTMNQLIWFRVIQGIGSGAIFPISFSIIYTIFADPKQAAKLSGVLGAVFGLSSVAGPQLGTWISENIGWRWCFYVNLPIGIASFFILLFALKESRSEKKPKIDYLGTFLLIISIVSILLGLEFGGKTYAWDSWQIIGLFLIGLIGTIAFIAVERKAEEPVLPLKIFKSRMVTGTSIICFCQGVIMFSAISYLPLFSVIVLKHANSNEILTPMMFSLIVGAITFGMLQSKFAFRTLMAFSMIMGLIAAFLLMNLSHEISNLQMTLLMILLGFGAIGPIMSVGQNAIAASVETRYIGVSSSIVGFWRSMGGVMGASIMAVLVNNSLKDQITTGAAQYNLNAEQMASLTKSENLIHLQNLAPELGEFVRNALGTAINKGFIVAAILLIIGVIASLMVGPARLSKKPEGQEAGVSHIA